VENALRKRLEILKNRAREIRRIYLARHGEGAPGETAPPVTLADAAPGEEIAAGVSSLYVIRTGADAVLGESAVLAYGFARAARDLFWRNFAVAPAFAGDSTFAAPYRAPLGPAPFKEPVPAAPSPADFCFFDIETTGLTPSTYVFLCGMMIVRDGRFVIEQAFARDYSEEAGMLRYVRDFLTRYPILVTFNGASFDLPFIRTRMAVARIEYDGPRDHLDLLPPARPRLRGVLPDCRLETIERHLRGAVREGDIPGKDIPDAYHEFVRTGDARKIKRILHHNRLDLLAMVGLFNFLIEKR
jgi:uncharacterized protein YprB with RNaseH-like and TPR domain